MEKLQTITNSLKEMLSGNVSPRTMQTKLRENMVNLTQSVDVPEVSIDVPEVSIDETIGITAVSFDKWYIFKIILAIVIIGLLSINAYTYVTQGQDAFTYFLGEDVNAENDTENGPKNGAENGPKNGAENGPKNGVGDDKATTAIHTAINIEAEKLSQEEKKNTNDIEKVIKKKRKKKKEYKANNLSNNINKKAGFCFIGADRNVRTCVEVGENDTCMSGEIFPTNSICINPSLKE